MMMKLFYLQLIKSSPNEHSIVILGLKNVVLVSIKEIEGGNYYDK
jgi:hypothetical protein